MFIENNEEVVEAGIGYWGRAKISPPDRNG